jgi:copper(I)-binding protein
MTLFKSTSLVLFTTLASLAFAQTPSANVEVKDAWVRSTVPGQKGTGAFMKITAKDGAKLVGVSSPVAGVGEVHEMKMEGDVMKMRALPSLDLPAGKAVELKPGGYHVMLMDLKQALVKDSKVAMTLVFKDANGAESKMELSLPVSNVAPSAPASPAAPGKASDHKH